MPQPKSSLAKDRAIPKSEYLAAELKLAASKGYYKKLSLPSYAEQWKWDIGNRIIKDWGGGELGHKAAAIAYAESSYNCGNTTGDDGRSWGLFQINIAHKKRWERHGFTRNDLKDCWKNQEIAMEIYHEQGWRPWGAATHPVGRPRYLQFLK